VSIVRLNPEPAIPFEACPLATHTHKLVYLYTLTDPGLNLRHRFQCPTNLARWWFTEGSNIPTRTKKPEKGWGHTKLDDGRIITPKGTIADRFIHLLPDTEVQTTAYGLPTKFVGCTAEEMGF
jgi:hypothetical protein